MANDPATFRSDFVRNALMREMCRTGAASVCVVPVNVRLAAVYRWWNVENADAVDDANDVDGDAVSRCWTLCRSIG